MVRKGGGLERLELCGHDLYRWSKDPRRPDRRESLRPARGGISRRVRAVPMVRREPRRKTGLERRGQRAAPTRTRRDEPRLARRALLGERESSPLRPTGTTPNSGIFIYHPGDGSHTRFTLLSAVGTSGYTRAAGYHGENSGYEGAVIEIGASLAEARVLRGLEIDDAANQTRLRAYYLHALEREEFEQLPPGSYRRAFLRTYAAFLDLDADLLVQEYVARYERARPRA